MNNSTLGSYRILLENYWIRRGFAGIRPLYWIPTESCPMSQSMKMAEIPIFAIVRQLPIESESKDSDNLRRVPIESDQMRLIDLGT